MKAWTPRQSCTRALLVSPSVGRDLSVMRGICSTYRGNHTNFSVRGVIPCQFFAFGGAKRVGNEGRGSGESVYNLDYSHLHVACCPRRHNFIFTTVRCPCEFWI